MHCETLWITVRDSTRLAADLYLPIHAVAAPVLLEALPYRKDRLRRVCHSLWQVHSAGA